jgi:hypothetical protein
MEMELQNVKCPECGKKLWCPCVKCGNNNPMFKKTLWVDNPDGTRSCGKCGKTLTVNEWADKLVKQSLNRMHLI